MREGVTEEMGCYGPKLYWVEEKSLGKGPFGGTLISHSTFVYSKEEGGKVDIKLSEGSNLLTGTSKKTGWLEEEDFKSTAEELATKALEKFWANLEEEME